MSLKQLDEKHACRDTKADGGACGPGNLSGQGGQCMPFNTPRLMVSLEGFSDDFPQSAFWAWTGLIFAEVQPNAGTHMIIFMDRSEVELGIGL
jgi:hypothetical protein